MPHLLRHLLVVALVASLLILAWSMPPLPQPAWYHDFSDQRSILGLAHFFNVISNLAFPAVAVWGIWQSSSHRVQLQHHWEHTLWRGFFASILLVGLGSAYYHLDPSNDTLLWDRLPIALAFALLLVIALVERIHTRLLWPGLFTLVPYAIFSVWYWWWSEHIGNGDLRPYLLLQILALSLLPVLYLLYPGRYGRRRGMLLTVLLYLLAITCEWHDEEIHTLTGWISGHTIKHLLVASSIASLVFMLRQRKARY